MLGLSDAEIALIRIKQSIAQRLHELRTKEAIAQKNLSFKKLTLGRGTVEGIYGQCVTECI